MDAIKVSGRLTKSFATKGIDPGRLELKGRCPHPKLLAGYNDVDIALDPYLILMS